MEDNVIKTVITDQDSSPVNRSNEEEAKTQGLPMLLQIQDKKIKADKTANEESSLRIDNADEEKNAPALIVDNTEHFMGILKNNDTRSASTIEIVDKNDNLHNINEDINSNINSSSTVVDITENTSNNIIKIGNSELLDNAIMENLTVFKDESLNSEIENSKDRETVSIALEKSTNTTEIVVDVDKTENIIFKNKNSLDINKDVKMVENTNYDTSLPVIFNENSSNETDNENNNLPVASEVVDNPLSGVMKQEAVKQRSTPVIDKVDDDLTESIALEDTTEKITLKYDEKLDLFDRSLDINEDVKMVENTNPETSLPVSENPPNEVLEYDENNKNLPTTSKAVDNPEKEVVVNFPQVIINTELLSTLSKQIQSITSTWTHRNLTKSHSLIELDYTTQEYIDVNSLFKRYCSRYNVRKIDRVENPFLLAQYLLKKAKMTQQLGFVEERKMFHGTNLSNVENICLKNLNWRLSGTARGHKFGRGISFSPDSYYSSHYTQSKLMFLVKVLVGNSHMGAESRLVPMDGYDTTDNNKGSVFVKYEDDDFYPNYVIYYGLNFLLDDSDSDDF